MINMALVGSAGASLTIDPHAAFTKRPPHRSNDDLEEQPRKQGVMRREPPQKDEPLTMNSFGTPASNIQLVSHEGDRSLRGEFAAGARISTGKTKVAARTADQLKQQVNQTSSASGASKSQDKSTRRKEGDHAMRSHVSMNSMGYRRPHRKHARAQEETPEIDDVDTELDVIADKDSAANDASDDSSADASATADANADSATDADTAADDSTADVPAASDAATDAVRLDSTDVDSVADEPSQKAVADEVADQTAGADAEVDDSSAQKAHGRHQLEHHHHRHHNHGGDASDKETDGANEDDFYRLFPEDEDEEEETPKKIARREQKKTSTIKDDYSEREKATVFQIKVPTDDGKELCLAEDVQDHTVSAKTCRLMDGQQWYWSGLSLKNKLSEGKCLGYAKKKKPSRMEIEESLLQEGKDGRKARGHYLSMSLDCSDANAAVDWARDDDERLKSMFNDQCMAINEETGYDAMVLPCEE
jgi:hypothetical protein